MGETIGKINETKISILTKKKRELTQITNIRNESGGITTDCTDIKKIIDYELLYTNLFKKAD